MPTPIPGLGNKSFMQFVAEVTPGTTPTFFKYRMEIITADVKPEINTIPDPSLYSGQSRRGFFEGAKIYRATVVMRPTYSGGILEILRGVSGSYTSPVVSGETIVFDHTFKEAADLKSYSMEFSIGDIPTGKVFRLVGARFSAITFRSTAGNSADAMVQCELTIIATDMLSDQTESKTIADTTTGTLSVPAAPANNTIIRSTGSFVTDGAKVGMIVRITGTAGGYPGGFAIITAVVALTLTVDRFAATTGSVTAVQYYAGFPPLLPILFHQAQFMDDGVCPAQASIPGTWGGTGTTFTRSDGLAWDTGPGAVVIGYHIGGSRVQVGTRVASFTNGANGTVTLTKASANPNGNTNPISAAAEIRVRSFEITLENLLTEDRFFMGSPSIDDALRSDFLNATFRMVQEFQDKAAFEAAKAFGTPLNPRIVFRIPGTLIGVQSNREFEIHMDSTQPGEWSTPIEGYGVLLSTMTLNAFNTPADQTAIAFRVRNDDAVLT